MSKFDRRQTTEAPQTTPETSAVDRTTIIKSWLVDCLDSRFDEIAKSATKAEIHQGLSRFFADLDTVFQRNNPAGKQRIVAELETVLTDLTSEMIGDLPDWITITHSRLLITYQKLRRQLPR